MNAVQSFSVGALLRRHFRAGLDQLGLDWNEHKGLLGSTFVVRGDLDGLAALSAWVRRVNAA